MSRAVYLHAPTAFAHRYTFHDRDGQDAFDQALARRVQDLCGRSLRQASRFIRLAAVAALTSVREAAPPPCTGVYLATGLGDQRTPARVFAQTRADLNAVSPFDFVNMNSNTAAYYIARLASLAGPNLTISQGLLSFEWALRQATIAIQGGLDHALVGGVDESAPSPAELERRYKLHPGESPGEGSAWLVLSTEPARAMGRLIDMRWLSASRKADWRQVHERVGALAAQDPIFVSAGPRVPQPLLAELIAALPRATPRTSAAACGDYPTASAFAIAQGLRDVSPSPATLLHVSADDHGRFVTMLYQSGNTL